MKRTNWVAMAVAAMTVVASAAAQSAAKRVIVVSLQDHKLALVEDGQLKKVYPVAVGKPSTPSPVGNFSIERRVVNPVYRHDGKTVQPGPNNPVGTRWMGLSIKGYGIHGTNAPKSIGKSASHGCIRMATPDLEELFEMVSVGDTVELIGEPNDETARLFGDAGDVAPIAQPVIAVENSPLAAPALPATPDLLMALSAGDAASGVAISAGGSR